MILLAAAQAAIMAWWTTIEIGGTPIQAVMVDSKQGGIFVKPEVRAIVKIDISAIRKIGQDETRFEMGIDPDELIPTINGNRVLTVSCRVDSFTQDDGNTAEHICEIARTRLMFPVILAALKSAGLALVDTFATVSLPFKVDDRVRSRAAFDVQFGIKAEETDATNVQDTIGSVELQSDVDDMLPLTGLTNIDGTPASTQIDLTVTEP